MNINVIRFTYFRHYCFAVPLRTNHRLSPGFRRSVRIPEQALQITLWPDNLSGEMTVNNRTVIYLYAIVESFLLNFISFSSAFLLDSVFKPRHKC